MNTEQCTACKQEITLYYMCEEEEGIFCFKCFDVEHCEKEHGEGCLTKVFIGDN